MNANAIAATSTWLGFELAGQNYAVPLADVHEIIRPELPTPVPGAPSDVLGIINLRGSIVTVLDGCRRLGLHDTRGEPPANPRLVIFDGACGNLGMRIDALQDVLELDTRELLPPLPGRAVRADDPVLGSLYHGNGFIALLDTAKLCRPRGLATGVAA